MKKIFLFLLPAAVMMSFAFSGFSGVLPIGSKLPNPTLKMKNVDGKDISFQDAKLKNGLMVMFSCNTCPWVIKNQSRTNEISKYALDNNIGVMLLNPNEAQRSNDDSYEAMKKYAKAQGYEWNYVVDKNHEMADIFGANKTPEIYLFNSDNVLVYHGAIDDNPGSANEVNRKHLKIAMDEMIQSKDVSVKETKSVGCAIKRIK
jgi:hypothetical protein